jgi:outer membrane scaffolding protein for murein synthesis (MipA/OmpV family)
MHQKRLPLLTTSFSIALLSTLALPLSGYAADAAAEAEEMVPSVPDPARFGPVRQQLHDWDFVIGAGAMYKPEYEGSDKMEISPVPYISATFFDRVTVDPGGIEIKTYEQGAFKFDINIGYDSGRDEDDSDDLRGMGDVDGGVSVGGKATINYGIADFFVSVDKTIGGSDALLAKAGVELTQPLSEKFILGASASATFADKNYMESYFGVDSGQSARSGYREYKAGAGVKSVDVGVSATYLFNNNWVLRGEQKLGVLVGDAADSPIVKEKLQSTTMVVLGYRF